MGRGFGKVMGRIRPVEISVHIRLWNRLGRRHRLHWLGRVCIGSKHSISRACGFGLRRRLLLFLTFV